MRLASNWYVAKVGPCLRRILGSRVCKELYTLAMGGCRFFLICKIGGVVKRWIFFFADKTQNGKNDVSGRYFFFFETIKILFVFRKAFLFSFASQRMKKKEEDRRQTMTDFLYPYPESSLEHRHLLLPPPSSSSSAYVQKGNTRRRRRRRRNGI